MFLYRVSKWPAFGRVGLRCREQCGEEEGNMAFKVVQEAERDYVGPRAACMYGTHMLDKHGDPGLLGRGATVGIESSFLNLRAYE